MNDQSQKAHDIVRSQGGAHAGTPWDESKHPRQPAGTESGGEFASSLLGSFDEEYPPVSDDPIPGKSYYYHATDAINIPAISRDGIRTADGSISLTPHMEAARQWGSMVSEDRTVLLRVRRPDVKARFYEGTGKGDPSYDARDPGAELSTHRSIPPDKLEIYRNGKWARL